MSSSKSSTDLRAGRGFEEEQQIWRERMMEEVRESVSAQHQKLQSEFGLFVQEIIGQMKIMSSSRKEDRELVYGLQGDNEELMRVIRSLGTRFERLEQRFFNYEMEVSSIREEGRSQLIQ